MRAREEVAMRILRVLLVLGFVIAGIALLLTPSSRAEAQVAAPADAALFVVSEYVMISVAIPNSTLERM